MSNPAIGGHVASALINATTYTSTGITTSASGSIFVAFISQGDSGTPTVSDTFNATGKWSLVTLGSGTNPIQEQASAQYLSAFVCLNASGGASDAISVTSSAGANLRYVHFVEITNTNSLDTSASAYEAATGDFVNVTVTPTGSNDLILASAYSGSGAQGAVTLAPQAGGWTALDGVNGSQSQGLGYLANAAASAQNAQMGQTVGALQIAGITLSFKPVSSGGGTISYYYLGSQNFY